MTAKRKSRWGAGIAAVYGAFALGTVAMVLFATTQNIDLVARDYYDQEIKYQNQIERLKRTAASTHVIKAAYDTRQQAIVIDYPDSIAATRLKGTITLFRPAAASHDRQVPITASTQHDQVIDCSRFAKGLWKVKIDWQIDDAEYYTEESIYVE